MVSIIGSKDQWKGRAVILGIEVFVSENTMASAYVLVSGLLRTVLCSAKV